MDRQNPILQIPLLAKLATILALAQLTACICDAEVFTYNLDIDFSITENRIPVNNSFDVTMDIPDFLMSNEGVENDVSNLDFEFNLTAYSYTNDTTINYWEFDFITSTLIIESEKLENNESFVIAEPTSTLNGREMRFTITPTVRDTILLAITVGGAKEGRGTCSPFHQIAPINNQLRLQDSRLNISQIGLTENPDNAIIIEVF